MDIKRARLYACLSLGAALLMLCLTLLFTLTLSYQAHRDGKGRGLNVIAQFLSTPMEGAKLAITSPFDKGMGEYDRDSDRRLIEEMLVRYYLEMRYTFIPDQREMMRRWGWQSPLARISTSKVHEKVVGKNLEDKIRKKVGVVETVNILDVQPESDAHQYGVIMQINTISDSGQYESNVYRATLGFKYRKGYRSFFREPINPYGLYFDYFVRTKFTNN